jgi:hypothetical protein
MSHFPSIDRDEDFLLPPSVQHRLPEGHLARGAVDKVEGQDLTELERPYAGRRGPLSRRHASARGARVPRGSPNGIAEAKVKIEARNAGWIAPAGRA